jgi:peroxiredoxin
MLISTDNVPSLREFAGKLGVSYPLLSDFATRSTAKAYGVLMEGRGMASRTTFVIDKAGRIQHIEEGKDAVDPTGALTACQRTKR